MGVIDSFSHAPPLESHVVGSSPCPITCTRASGAIRYFILPSANAPPAVGLSRRHLIPEREAQTDPLPATHQQGRVAWLDLRYGYGTNSKMGERLIASGHIRTPREYAITLDPFLGFGRVTKEVALSRFGHEFDDNACYPNITRAIIPTGNTMAQLFTEHKTCILTAIGLYYFPLLTNNLPEARSRAKQLCHSLDNDGTIYGFCRTYSLPLYGAGFKPPSKLTITLPGGVRFNLQRFIDEKTAQIVWLAQQRPRMLSLIQALGGRERPNATLRSFVNQDFEGVGRRAKIAWAHRHRQHPLSNQHDGVRIGLDRAHDPHSVATTLFDDVSAAVGYLQRVEVKPPEEAWPDAQRYDVPIRANSLTYIDFSEADHMCLSYVKGVGKALPYTPEVS